MPRVQLELGEELTKLGHEVSVFSWADAFPRGLPNHVPGKLTLFAIRASQYLQINRHQFDVVDAQQGNLLASSKTLGFAGTVVVRSAGLVDFYYEWFRTSQVQLRTGQNRLGAVVRRTDWSLIRWATYRSFQVADRIITINDDETAYMTQISKWAAKVRFVPNALSLEAWVNLAKIAGTKPDQPPTISFIGSWHHRKGSYDWPKIIRTVWASLPNARFRLLGTGVAESVVRRELAVGGDRRVTVVPRFDPPDLSLYLAGTACGCFPSYIEGFGLGVLEQLAAGIPVVAYDVPGPRMLLQAVDSTLLVKRGDIHSLAARLITLLQMNDTKREYLSARCQYVSSGYTWSALAEATLRAYVS